MKSLLNRISAWGETLPPAFLPVLWFAVQIAVGTLLLWLPWSRSAHSDASFVTALFTATSATCVTGLTVVDSSAFYSPFGQVVIAVLIEVGGLGVMTFAALGFQLFRQRLSLAAQAVLDDSLFQHSAAREFKSTFWRIVRITACIQLIGAVFILPSLAVEHAADGRGFFFAVLSALFHAVSAFCNAGFSLYSDNLCRFADRPMMLLPIMALVVAGGIGHTVLVELYQAAKRFGLRKTAADGRKTFQSFSLHTKVVLCVSSMLIVGGSLLLYAIGTGPNGERDLLSASFQAVSGRTAGFNTIPINGLPMAGVMLMIVLMFIGGSPGSCAGGIKTTSLATLYAWFRSFLRRDPEVHLFDRALSPELMNKVGHLIALSLVWNLLGVFFLALTEPTTAAAAQGHAGVPPDGWGLDYLLFEQVSAFGTVGMSMGVTPSLSTPGQLWIALTMYMGRLGPLALIMSMAPLAASRVRRAYGRIMVG